MPSEPRFPPIELEQIHANICKLMAETAKLNAEASKFALEREQFPMMVVAGLIGAMGAAIGVGLTFLLKFH